MLLYQFLIQKYLLNLYKKRLPYYQYSQCLSQIPLNNKVLKFYIIRIPNYSSEMNAIQIFKNYINIFYYKCYSNLKYVS